MDQQALAHTQQQYTRVSRKKLITRLKQTKAHHVKQYEELLAGWRKKFTEELRETADRCTVLSGKAEGDEDVEVPSIRFSPKPTSHEADYTRAIARFSMSLDDHIWLSHDDFNTLVMDDWRWKGEFIASARLYMAPGVFANNLFSPELSADFLEGDEE